MSIFFAYAHANGIDGSCWFMIYEDVLKKIGAVEFWRLCLHRLEMKS